MNAVIKFCLSTCAVIGIVCWLRFQTKGKPPEVSSRNPSEISVLRENRKPVYDPTSSTSPPLKKELQSEVVYSTEFLSQLRKPFSGTFEISEEFAKQMELTAEEKEQLILTTRPFFDEIKELERIHVSFVSDPQKGDYFRISPYPEGADLLARLQEAIKKALPNGKGKAIAAVLQTDSLASSFGTYTEEIYMEDVIHQGNTLTVVSWNSSGNAGDVVSWKKQLNRTAILQRFPWFENLAKSKQ